MNPYEVLYRVRAQKPLVHHLTNWVTIYDCANITKAFGASPVMAHAEEEVEEMATIASSLVLNIGTLTTKFVESMKLAAKSANRKKIPVILDVCGAGATIYRDNKCFELLDQTKIDVIKGNSSEIARISGENVFTKGVDALAIEKDLIKIARDLASLRKATVVITGAEDIVTDGNIVYLIKNGHEMMEKIVGTGCMVASVIGAFCAVEKNLPLASAAALSVYGITGELAAKDSLLPGTFKEKFFNHAYSINEPTIKRMQKIETR